MREGGVRACIVGLGWWGGEIVSAARKVEGFSVTACFARTPSTREKFGSDHSCRTLDSWEAVLRDPEIDAVILATPHSTHARMVEEAASAGKHIWVEKPFVLQVPDGQRALAACEKAGVRLTAGHQRRFQPAHREIKRLIGSGALGQVIQTEANFSYGFAAQVEAGSWRADPGESPSGSMTGLGIHHLDTFQYLFGPISSVFASSRSVSHQTDLDDVTAVLIEFESGAQGYLGSNMLTPKVFYVNVYGTGGNAFAENEGTRLTLVKKGVDEPEVIEYAVEGNPVTAPLVNLISDFTAAIREGREPEVDGATALRTSAAIEAITRSSREGRKVELAELYE
ncbi:MAG: Gfo/Idh/MocA family oxidoreductase [bacterium]|nr:Gfo/Idh/MocA family oxidoreductase [bacterium]